MSRLWFGVALVAAVLAPPAWAGSVYLNGVNIDEAHQALDFKKVDVRIDEKGNVFIQAKGYKVEVQHGTPPVDAGASPATSPPPPQNPPPQNPPQNPQASDATPPPPPSEEPPRITHRYWLVTEQTAPGMTQYDIDVYLNSTFIRRLRNDDDQTIMELTKLLVPGKNTLLLRAHKVLDGARKSFSADHLFRVIVGTGNVGGDKFLIDKQLVSFERNASQTDDYSQEFTFVTE